MTASSPAAMPDGVYYATRDCAGLGRRLFSGAIDVAVLFAGWVVVYSILVGDRPGVDELGKFRLASCALAWAYLAPLKALRLRTLGYRVAGLRVVDLRGGRPSLVRMTLRCALLLTGTGFLMIDMAWLLGNRDRQKISDLLAGTYVVRSTASPAGRGALAPAVYCVFSYFLVCGEVRRGRLTGA